jgi:hypothetical protein
VHLLRSICCARRRHGEPGGPCGQPPRGIVARPSASGPDPETPPPPSPPPGRSDPSDAIRKLQAVRTLPSPARPEGRDAKGRFAPGNSGRPKGARSRLITELELAMEVAAPEIVRILIGRAQCGDGSMEAAKYILERIAPSRRGRLVEIEGFEVRTPADVPAALASLATAIGDGMITIEEATAMIGHRRSCGSGSAGERAWGWGCQSPVAEIVPPTCWDSGTTCCNSVRRTIAVGPIEHDS